MNLTTPSQKSATCDVHKLYIRQKPILPPSHATFNTNAAMLALELIPAKSMDVQSATPGNVIALFPQLALKMLSIQLLPCLLLTKPVSKHREKDLETRVDAFKSQ